MKTKNKTRYLQSILGAILAVSAALVLSCEQPDGSSVGAPAGKGGVAITVSTGGPAGSVLKTILPTKEPTFSSYDLVFKSEDGEDEVTARGTGETIEQVLAVGEWTVTVTGNQTFVIGGDSKEYPAARGTSEKFEVEAGEFTDVPVDISPIPLVLDEADEDLKDATGIFAYDITYPAGAEGELTLTLMEEGGETPEEATTVTLTGTEAKGSTALAPGYYTLKITLTKDKVEGEDEDEDENALVTGDSAGVYIYAGLESKAEFTFTDEDFVQKVYITGIIPRLTNAVEFVADNIKVYGDSGFEEPFDAVTEIITADKDLIWYAEIPAANIGKNFYVKAETTNGGTTYTATYNNDGEKPLTLTKAPIPKIDLELKVSGKVSTDDLLQVITLNDDFELGGLEITNPETATPINFGTTKVTVTGDSTIPANVTVQFDDGEDKGSFTVVDGATLTVAGAVDVSKAAVVVAGTLNVTGTGKLTVARPEDATAADTFYGEDGTGKIVLAKGSTLVRQNDGVAEPYLSSSSSSIYSWSRREADKGKLVLAKNSLTLEEGPLTVNDDASILADDTVTIANDAKLTIVPTKTFTVGGTLNVAAEAEVTVNGTLVMADKSKGDLDGTITVAATGVSKDLNSGGGSLWKGTDGSTGEYVFKAGAKAYVQRWQGEANPYLVIGGKNDDADIKLADYATFYNSRDAYTLDGNATIAKDYGIAVKTVTIEGVLTVDADLELIGATNLVGYEGSRIVLKKDKEIIGVNGKNFYTAAGEAITKDITASTGDQVFAWSYDVDGNEGGWQGSGANLFPIKLVDEPEDADFEIEGLAEGTTLYKNGSPTVTVSVPTSYSTYKWVIDGGELGTSATLVLNPRELAVKTQTLTVFVTDSSSNAYSKDLTFTVEFEATPPAVEQGE